MIGEQRNCIATGRAMMFEEWLHSIRRSSQSQSIEEVIANCKVVFADAAPVPAETSPKIRRHLKQRFARPFLDRLGVALFTEKEPVWPLLIGDVPLRLVGGVPHGRNIYLFFEGDSLYVLIQAGRNRVGLFDCLSSTFILFSARGEDAARVHLGTFLRAIYSDAIDFEGYFRAMAAGTLRRALVIGDARPAHYLSQCLNYMGRALVPKLPTFAAMGGVVVVVTDQCFIDPREVFPQLAELPSIDVTAKQLTGLVLEKGLLCHRYVHMGSRGNFASIQAFAREKYKEREALLTRADEETRVLGVWICLDIERSRFTNQVSALAAALRFLAEFADWQGKALRIFWDGWTVGVNDLTPRDKMIIGKLRQCIQEINQEFSLGDDQVELFTKPLVEKLSLAAGAQIAFATYGTASLITNIIAGIPTVSYHSREVIEAGGYTDASNHCLIMEPELTVRGASTLLPHLREFEIAPSVLVGATRTFMEGLGSRPPAGADWPSDIEAGASCEDA